MGGEGEPVLGLQGVKAGSPIAADGGRVIAVFRTGWKIQVCAALGFRHFRVRGCWFGPSGGERRRKNIGLRAI